MVAAYAVALQALLGAVVTSQAAVGADPFAICLGGDDGTPLDHGNGKSQAFHDCQLCTLANASCTIPGVDQAAARDVVLSSIVTARTIDRIVSYDSPTGQYQRGPPGAFAAG